MTESVLDPSAPPSNGSSAPRFSRNTALFSATLLVGSFLLFLVQPMFARMILPRLGGTPAVWNTCMVFFQACLLAGYAYAHGISTKLPRRPQLILHAVILLLPLLVLPVALPNRMPPTESNPIPWLLMILALAVGLPFVVVSTGGPLMQKWFASTGQRGADDPYFLYAASNVGSVLALLAYPLIVEPMLRLDQQAKLWSAAYLIWIFLTLLCALRVWTNHVAQPPPAVSGSESESQSNVPLRLRAKWILLAFIPSSYLLGVTTFMTSDIAAVPLLWIIPLALYLLSFSLAFANRKLLPHKLMVFALPTSMLGAILWMLAHAIYPAWLILSLHLLAFFVAAMVCHGELARTRPSARHLTDFYLMISLGGVLGGIFNAIVAPLVFSRTIEYPLAMFLAVLVCPPRRMFRTDNVILPVELKKVLLDLLLAPTVGILAWFMLRFLSEDARAVVIFLLLAVPILLALSFVEHRMRFALAIGALLLVFLFPPTIGSGLLDTCRSFFGVHRVIQSKDRQFTELYHGTTLHGREFSDPVTLAPLRPDEPLTYYTSAGPAGQVLRALPPERTRNIAVVGLGTGTLAAYARPGTRMTFFEIDPTVRDIAEHSGRFGYIAAARERGADIRIVLGDARLTLASVPDNSLDVLLLDAFSGDAIPIHLLTREALDLYLRKLAPRGLVVVHVSNIFLNLKPVLANVAASAECVAIARDDLADGVTTKPVGWQASQWVAIARHRDDFDSIAQDPRWKPLRSTPARVWTDDYSNILGVFRWRYTTADTKGPPLQERQGSAGAGAGGRGNPQ